MKVLFAVSSESISEAIVKKYQKTYKEILSYKNVYYFNAILKEIQKDKSYDRIVISEDLESFSNNNYDAIDKFIFEKLDEISDEAQDIDGNETSIILICTDRRTKGSSFLVKLFGIGIYNALLGTERSMEQVCKLINKPRVKKEAKLYYKIDSEDVNYSNKSGEEVSETEIQNILIHFKKLGKNTDKYADSFNNIASQYTDEQLKIVINCLPNNVKNVLQSDCKKYQEIVGVNGMIDKSNSDALNNKENQKKTGIKIDMIENKTGQNKMSGPIVIPSSVRTSKNRGPVQSRADARNIEIPKTEKVTNDSHEKKIIKKSGKEKIDLESENDISIKNENNSKVSEIKNKNSKEKESNMEEKIIRKDGKILKKKVKKESGKDDNLNKKIVKKHSDLEDTKEEKQEVKINHKKVPPLKKNKKDIIEEENLDDEVLLPGMDEDYDDEPNIKSNNDLDEDEMILPDDDEFEVENDDEDEIEDDSDGEEEFEIEDEDEESEEEVEDSDDEEEEFEIEDEDEESEEEVEDSDDEEEFEIEDEDEESEEVEDSDDEEEEFEIEDEDEDSEEEDDSEDEEEEFEIEDEDSEEEVEDSEDEEEFEIEDEDEDSEEEVEDSEDEEEFEIEDEDEESEEVEDSDDEEEFEEDYDEDSDEDLEDVDDDYSDEVSLPDVDDLDDFDSADDEVDDEFSESDDNDTIFEEDENEENTEETSDSESEDYDNQNAEIETIKPKVDYSMSSLNSLITKDKKIVTFLGTTKNGTSFLINNLAALFSSIGINTAILDMTKNKNSYYIYTNNEEELRNIAYNSIYKLQNGGIAEGIKVNNNLSVYTALPNDGKDYSNAEPILSTLVQNHSLILIDCDFDTDPSYFASCQEIYLVQSMDILTIQPLTAFLRNLKSQGVLESEKVRVVINKELKVRSLTTKAIIAGMSFYNDPSMSFMTELFNKDMVKACSIPFEENVYSKYLDEMVNCNVSLNGYSKQFMSKLRNLGEMVYPLVGKSTYGKTQTQTNYGKNNFSSNINNTLNQMKKKY